MAEYNCKAMRVGKWCSKLFEVPGNSLTSHDYDYEIYSCYVKIVYKDVIKNITQKVKNFV